MIDFWQNFWKNENFGKLQFWGLGLRIGKCKIRRIKDLKIEKFRKIENFERKLKMSHDQNVLFGVSGNLAKLVFSKILPEDLNIRNQNALRFCNPIFLQNLSKISKIPQNLIQITTIFKKTSSTQPNDVPFAGGVAVGG